MYNNNFYRNLNKPKFTPPAIAFKYAWSVLYTLMIISAALIIRQQTEIIKTKAYLFFSLQLLCNIIWPPIFFLFKKIKIAFIISILLTFFAILNAIFFYEINQLAAFLLIPYILWLIFAVYLNFAFIRQNQN
ncbi:MAG: TspO/MBR family protein [Candidatus Gastranaerophilaceae bacterium]